MEPLEFVLALLAKTGVNSNLNPHCHLLIAALFDQIITIRHQMP